MNFDLIPAKLSDHAIFNVWQQRYVAEYNSSTQWRQGYQVVAGVPKQHWDATFENTSKCLWIKHKGRTIGYVTMIRPSIGKDHTSAQPVWCVEDVYVEPRSRGKGVLRNTLLKLRTQGIEIIVIDLAKLDDNTDYYVNLGFRYTLPWGEHELFLASPSKCVDVEWIENW